MPIRGIKVSFREEVLAANEAYACDVGELAGLSEGDAQVMRNAALGEDGFGDVGAGPGSSQTRNPRYVDDVTSGRPGEVAAASEAGAAR